MEQNQIYPNKKLQPLIIDLKSIWQAIKRNKKLYYIVLPIAFVVGAVIAKSIPTYYKCQ